MPRIDEAKFKKPKFKKSTARSWDTDLLSSLKIKELEPDTNVEPELNSNNKGSELNSNNKGSELNSNNKGSELNSNNKGSKLNSNNKGSKLNSNSSIKPKEQPSFLSDEFRFRKLLMRLSGSELSLLRVLLDICNKNNSHKTGKISGEDLDTFLDVPRNTRETAIKRLCKKGLIRRFPGTRGVNGTISLGFISEAAMNIANELYGQVETET